MISLVFFRFCVFAIKIVRTNCRKIMWIITMIRVRCITFIAISFIVRYCLFWYLWLFHSYHSGHWVSVISYTLSVSAQVSKVYIFTYVIIWHNIGMLLCEKRAEQIKIGVLIGFSPEAWDRKPNVHAPVTCNLSENITRISSKNTYNFRNITNRR